MNTTSISEQHVRWIVWVLLLLPPINGMAVDLISPSLPAMAKTLSVSEHIIKNVISIYLLGYALGNFFTGFLADAWGRQRLLRWSLIAFFFVSILPVFCNNIDVLLFSRLLQGLALGAMGILYKTVFSDILEPARLIKMGIVMGTMWGIGPIIGPVIGGYLQYYFGWQSCFIFFSIVGFLLSFFVFFVVPETHFNRHPLNFTTIKNNIIEVVRNQLFLATVILMGCSYSLIIVFNTIAPFFIQNTLGHSSIFFGHLALWMGVVFLASTLSCKSIVKKYSVEKVYFVGIHVFFIVALFGVLLSLYFKTSLILLIAVTAIMYTATGFIFPMSMGKGVSLFRHISGAASAVMYLINILMTSAASYLATFAHSTTITPIFIVYFCLLLICFIVYWKLIHAK